jgi:hypothetical protein
MDRYDLNIELQDAKAALNVSQAFVVGDGLCRIGQEGTFAVEQIRRSNGILIKLPKRTDRRYNWFGSIRISYAHGLTGRIPTAAARTARGVGCLGSTAR